MSREETSKRHNSGHPSSGHHVILCVMRPTKGFKNNFLAAVNDTSPTMQVGRRTAAQSAGARPPSGGRCWGGRLRAPFPAGRCRPACGAPAAGAPRAAPSPPDPSPPLCTSTHSLIRFKAEPQLSPTSPLSPNQKNPKRGGDS